MPRFQPKCLVIGWKLDRNIGEKHTRLIQHTIESDSDNRVTDIHAWKVGPVDYAAIISLVMHHPQPSEYYKSLINERKELSHVTIEVNVCNEG